MLTSHDPAPARIAAQVRDGVARAVAAVGLLGVALIHVLDAPSAFAEIPYQGGLYVALIAGCTATAAALVAGSDPRVWLAATLLPLGAASAYVVSRTVGLPQGADDIGNWSEPLGIASLYVEGTLAALGAAVLAGRRAPISRPSGAAASTSARPVSIFEATAGDR